jgi:site-specific recombinase XerD
MLVDLILEYLEYLESSQLYSFNSLRLYRSDLLQFASFLQNKSKEFQIQNLSAEILNDYSDQILKQKRSVATINRKLTAIHGLWNWLREKGLVNRDPFTQINRQAQYRNPKSNYLNEDEVIILLDCADHEIKTKIILELIYATGIRVFELTKLTITDIDLDNQLITIMRSPRFKERVIPFNASLAKILESYIETNQLKPESKLLLNKFGKTISEREVYRTIKEAAKKSGLNKTVSPSILRNSFIQHLKQNGAHDCLLKDLTGQKIIRI